MAHNHAIDIRRDANGQHRAHCVCGWAGTGRRVPDVAVGDGQDHCDWTAALPHADQCEARHPYGHRCRGWTGHRGSHQAPMNEAHQYRW